MANQRAKIAYGLSQPNFPVGPSPIISGRVPMTSDFAEIGTLWIESTTNQMWVLTNIIQNQATWTEIDSTNIVVGGVAWNTIVGVGPVAMVANSGYKLTNAAAVALTLPATSPLGSQILIATSNAAAGGFVISQNAGQNIVYGDDASTVGIAGTVRTTIGIPVQYQSLWMICTVADTQWTIFATNCANINFA